MLKNDTLKNGTSCIGLYGNAPSPPPGDGVGLEFKVKATVQARALQEHGNGETGATVCHLDVH